MANAVVVLLLEKLVAVLVSEGRQLLEFDNQFEDMKKELLYIQSYLKDAEKVKRRDRKEILKMVMIELRDIVYDAEDIIADCQILFVKHYGKLVPNWMSYCSPSYLKSRNQLGKRLQIINKRIGKVKERMISYLGTAHGLTSHEEDVGIPPLTYPILIDEEEIVGLEDDSAKIRGWAMEANGALTVIGIVGMGGIGKTTLAQKVCNSANMKARFKHMLQVSVSQSFRLDELLKKMLRKLQADEESIMGKEVDELLKNVRFKLDGRFLIVLDDVWGVDKGLWWDSLKSGLPQKSGSCVIVTTRNGDVLKLMGAVERHIHCPQFLSDEDGWSLFAKIAFARNNGNCTNLDLESIGKEIVVRCGGLPLLVKVVGGIILGKGYSVQDWRRILNHLKEELVANKRDELVISRLEFSFEELPTHLKPCLLCFAMFPEDCKISMYYMVRWWIGEGFIWGRNGRTASEIGEECFAELLSRCLTLGVDKEVYERRFVTCRMHDLIRDMVIKIAREENFMGLDDGGGPIFSAQSVRAGIYEDTEMESFRTNPKLRTLVGMDIKRKEVIINVGQKLCEVKWLRVLVIHFKSSIIDEHIHKSWLTGIGSLRHLIYLNLANSGIVELPNSIGNLHNLKIIRFYNCPKLKRLSPQLATLEKLTSLQIFGCGSLRCMPKGIGKLTNLQTLRGFRTAGSRFKDSCQVAELKNLTQLRQFSIHITSDDQVEEGELNVLSKLHQLHSLSIGFTGHNGSIGLVEKVDHQLSPLQHLRELYIYDFPGERTPTWLSPTSFPNLQLLGISGGRFSHMGPGFWDTDTGTWKLEILGMENLDELEEEWPKMQRALPLLRMLKVYNCPKLKWLPFNVEREGTWKQEDDGVCA